MKLVKQRTDGDCGVASVAMIAEQSYEDAYIAATQVQPECRGKRGLHNKEVVEIAKRLGMKLSPKRKYDLDDDEGILRVRWLPRIGRSAADVKGGGHYVVVIHGLIVCPSYLEIMPWRDYLQRNLGKACTLLAKDE